MADYTSDGVDLAFEIWRDLPDLTRTDQQAVRDLTSEGVTLARLIVQHHLGTPASTGEVTEQMHNRLLFTRDLIAEKRSAYPADYIPAHHARVMRLPE